MKRKHYVFKVCYLTHLLFLMVMQAVKIACIYFHRFNRLGSVTLNTHLQPE